MTFESAVEFTSLMPFPADVSCLSNSNARMLYSMEGDSIVPEVSFIILICIHNIEMDLQTVVGPGLREQCLAHDRPNICIAG